MTWNRTTSLTALVVLTAAAGFFATRLIAHKHTEAAGTEGAAMGPVSTTPRHLPDYQMVGDDMQEVPADSLRHGRVLLVYLTTNCDPCAQEAGVISRLHRDAPPDLKVYGVGLEKPAQMATFLKGLDLKFPMLVDVGSQLARSIDVHYFPSKFLVEDGVITKEWRGRTKDEAALRRQLGLQ
jgi:peroxiredoxin